jgi:hypothetical protein
MSRRGKRRGSSVHLSKPYFAAQDRIVAHRRRCVFADLPYAKVTPLVVYRIFRGLTHEIEERRGRGGG